MSTPRRRRPVPPPPTDPTWTDGIPRIVSNADGLRGLVFGVAVPGTGEVVAAFKDEELAKEFVCELAPRYTLRAEKLFKRADEARMDPGEREFRGITAARRSRARYGRPHDA